jgi:hypothetical protein
MNKFKDEEKTPRAILINYNSGEIIDTAYDGDKVKITHDDKENNKKAFLDKYDTEFNKGESFVKLYDKTLAILRNNLKPAEFVFAISLAEYISYSDGILRKGGHGNGKFLTMEDLSKEMGVDYNVVRRIMPVLTKKGILCKYEVGCVENPKLKVKGYVCNPWIYMRGTFMDKTIIGLFEKSGWKELLNK